MLLTRSDFKTTNEELFVKIQEVYSAYFKPETEYTHGKFGYSNAVNYGYIDFEERNYHGRREFTADEYVAFCGTHCDHIVIKEEYKNRFFEGLRSAVLEAGNKVVFLDTYVMFLAKKPM